MAEACRRIYELVENRAGYVLANTKPKETVHVLT